MAATCICVDVDDDASVTCIGHVDDDASVTCIGHVDDDASVTCESIALTCPFSQRRIMQAARTEVCVHATAFCASVRDRLQMDSGHCRCPLCGAEADLIIDGPLTLFLSAHPSAVRCAVLQRGDRTWEYRTATRAKRQRGSHPPRSHPPPVSSAASRATAPSRAASEATTTTDWAGEHRRPQQRSFRQGSSSEAAWTHHSSDSGATRGQHAQRKLASTSRAIRREHAARKRQLDQTKAELIRRALHEDSSTGDALWNLP